MDKSASHARLDALAAEIKAAKKHLESKGKLHLEKQTAESLLARYKVLKAQLDGEIADLEEHGHHVGALERSFRKWFDSVDLDA
jgi:hypothetical protein